MTTLLSCRPLRRNCQLLLLSSIVIFPPLSIVIATAFHLAFPPTVPLLHWRQSSAAHCDVHCASSLPLPIAINLLSCCPLRRCCPSLLPPSIGILASPSIVIATAVHLASPPIAPLLRWRQSSATHCAVHGTNANPLPIVIALPSHRPLHHRCPLPLLPFFMIELPPSIVIATAIQLASPPITPLLRWQGSSAAHCAIHHATAVPSPITIALPTRYPLRHHCPSPLPLSITILPLPYILIAAAIHLVSPPHSNSTIYLCMLRNVREGM
jgi:hypothetical protein